MTGSVILQSARIPAVIASVALGAMALPVLFTGVNGGLDCERSTAALTAASRAAAPPVVATGALASTVAPPPMIAAQPLTETLPLLTRGSDGVPAWGVDGVAGFDFKNAGQEDVPPSSLVGAAADAAGGRDGPTEPSISVRRARAAGPRIVARGAAESVSSEPVRKLGPRRTEASGSAMGFHGDGSNQSASAGAPSDGGDVTSSYIDGGFTPNE